MQNVSVRMMVNSNGRDGGFSRQQASTGGTPTTHVGISCDSCGVSPLQGVRYRCSVCPDYDLCDTCIVAAEAGNPAVHPAAHLFLRIPRHSDDTQRTPQVTNRSAYVHRGVHCDACVAPFGASPAAKPDIVGYRFECLQCELNLCEACEALGKHDPSHPRVKRLPKTQQQQQPPPPPSFFQPAAPSNVRFGMAFPSNGRDGGFNRQQPPPGGGGFSFGGGNSSSSGGGFSFGGGNRTRRRCCCC